MELFLVFDKEADERVEGGCFEQACFAIVGEAERDGFAVAAVDPQVMDRLRKMVARRPGIADVWVAAGGKVVPLGMAAEVLLVMGGCKVNEQEVDHDWFGQEVK